MMRFTVSVVPGEEGGFTVQCIEVPGAISEGETIEEALENIEDAIAEVLAARREEATRLHARLESVDVDA
ncbi:MAG TPA: type II toxin-antitoxin system HicB family antitoxin [Candidatus Thermoplasmatota archaeon]|nr:type II toxin-antitoxin system HicB family antitoxin [Candidatus Thermoplasmatota archaeon]